MNYSVIIVIIQQSCSIKNNMRMIYFIIRFMAHPCMMVETSTEETSIKSKNLITPQDVPPAPGTTAPSKKSIQNNIIDHGIKTKTRQDPVYQFGELVSSAQKRITRQTQPTRERRFIASRFL